MPECESRDSNIIKLSGFTFVRNVLKQEYPVLESINSILPIVDEFIINVGPSDDETLELIRSIADPKTMTKRVDEYPAVIDFDSPLWRRSLTWKERSQIIKTVPLYNRLVNRLFGKGSYVLLNE